LSVALYVGLAFHLLKVCGEMPSSSATATALQPHSVREIA